VDSSPGFPSLTYGPKPGATEGWICEAGTFPAIKWFDTADRSQIFPFPVSCYRVEKHVVGYSWREFAAWTKLARLLSNWPL
jgi:hypothetical protein